MEPLNLFKMLWHYKWVVLPVLLLTGFGCAYVFIAQSSYVATGTYVLVSPKTPSDREILADPKLGKLNSDNPYLRSPDGLLSQVLIAKLTASSESVLLKSAGYSTDYTVTLGGSGMGNSMMLQITSTGNSPAQATDTAAELGTQLQAFLHDVQKVNGADDAYLIKAQAIELPDTAQASYSSRLRSMTIVLAGGGAALFGAVAAARRLTTALARRRPNTGTSRRRSRRGGQLPQAHLPTPLETVPFTRGSQVGDPPPEHVRAGRP